MEPLAATVLAHLKPGPFQQPACFYLMAPADPSLSRTRLVSSPLPHSLTHTGGPPPARDHRPPMHFTLPLLLWKQTGKQRERPQTGRDPRPYFVLVSSRMFHKHEQELAAWPRQLEALKRRLEAVGGRLEADWRLALQTRVGGWETCGREA